MARLKLVLANCASKRIAYDRKGFIDTSFKNIEQILRSEMV